MASIMQGTTPSVIIKIDPDDLLLSAVNRVELYVRNGEKLETYTAEDLVLDTDANTVVKTFTEAETAAFDPEKTVVIQGRLWAGNSIFGTTKLRFTVADMEGVGSDG